MIPSTNRVRAKVLPLAAMVAFLVTASAFALTRPAPLDSITAVAYTDDNQQAYVNITVSPHDNSSDFDQESIKYHAVLAADLSVSFDEA
jgi:hypothetical protein